MTALLSVSGLAKRFSAGRRGSYVHALDDVGFDVAAGETLGIVGESGCGKTTLSRVLARLIDPTAGDIRFDGRNIASIPASRFPRHPDRRAIQLVFQDAGDSLNPRQTAADAIAEPLRRLCGLRGPGLAARVVQCADLTGLPRELLSRYPHQLSGGQKARVGIARAIAPEPRLLILDEPTSALDVSVQATILHLLADLRARLGLTCVFVSHDLNVVRLMCDRVLVLYLGRIMEIGAANDVFDRPMHPYSRALAAAIPTGQRPTVVSSVGESGTPIDPSPSACRYAARCPDVIEMCRRRMPQLHRVGTGAVACHLSPASGPADRAANRPPD